MEDRFGIIPGIKGILSNDSIQEKKKRNFMSDSSDYSFVENESMEELVEEDEKEEDSNVNMGRSSKDAYNDFYNETINNLNVSKLNQRKNLPTSNKVEKLNKLWKNGRYIWHPRYGKMLVHRKLKLNRLSLKTLNLSPKFEYRLMDYVFYLDSSCLNSSPKDRRK